jgi:hypothetical protein
MYSLKEIDDGLFLFEHTTQAGSCVTALKQIDKEGDKKKKDSGQKAECFWLHRHVHGFSPNDGLYTRDFRYEEYSPRPWTGNPPFHPDGMAGGFHIPMEGNTGAGDNELCFHLFGLGRICLHFNSG